MERSRQFDTVEMTVGTIRALCPRCKGTSFLRSRRPPGINSDSLICTACGLETARTALMNQLGSEVARHARKTLDALKALRKH
jgi:hypothetical protein